MGIWDCDNRDYGIQRPDTRYWELCDHENKAQETVHAYIVDALHIHIHIQISSSIQLHTQL